MTDRKYEFKILTDGNVNDTIITNLITQKHALGQLTDAAYKCWILMQVMIDISGNIITISTDNFDRYTPMTELTRVIFDEFKFLPKKIPNLIEC